MTLGRRAAPSCYAFKAASNKSITRTEVSIVGRTPVLSEKAWTEYQNYATGSQYETVFQIDRATGATDQLLAEHFTNSFIVEAKYGDMGQLFNFDTADKILKQAANYLTVAEELNLRGIRYVVSEVLGVERLKTVLTVAFPEAMASGKIQVWWVPK